LAETQSPCTPGREQETAPTHDRLKELHGEITDLQRRIERQVANLEAEDATPSPRRRVGARIAEEEALEERRQHANALAAQSADVPPTVVDLTTAHDRLPLLAERLRTCPSQNSGRCSTACSCRSPSSRRHARSTLRARSSRTKCFPRVLAWLG